MVTCKHIIDNLKKQDISSLLEDIQILLQPSEVSFAELNEIVRNIRALLSEHEDSSSASHKLKLQLAPSIDLCVDHVKVHFKHEKLTLEAFIRCLFHIIKSYLKSELYVVALSYGENCVQFLSDCHDAKSFNTLLGNFSQLFWNEAYSLEKQKNDFPTAYKLRCKAFDFKLLGDVSSSLDKFTFAFIRYSLCKGRDANEVTNFMKCIWSTLSKKRNEEPFSLYGLLYSWFQFHMNHYKHPLILELILNCLLELVAHLNQQQNSTNNFLIACLRVSIVSIETFLLKEKKSISKKLLASFKSNLSNCFTEPEKRMFLLTWHFFRINLSSIEVQIDEIGPDVLLAKENLEFILTVTTEYFRMSPNDSQKDEANLYHGDLSFSITLIKILACLIKNEKSIQKIQVYIKEAQNFIGLSISKLALTNAPPCGTEKNIFFYATSIGHIASILYRANIYMESIWFIEKNIDLLSNCKELNEELKKNIWKKKEISVLCYFRSGFHRKALCKLVQNSLEDTSKRKECMKLWYTIKKEALKTGCKDVISRTVSDVLQELDASICVQEELYFLLEELKYPIQERSTFDFRHLVIDELVAVVHKVYGLPLNGILRAKALLEIVNIFPSISDKISMIDNKSILDLCIESICLFKEHLSESPDDNDAKLQLSISYFWLYFLKQSKIHEVSEKEAEVCLAIAEGEKKLENEENEICDIQPIFPLVNYLVEMDTINSLELALDIWLEVFKGNTNLSTLVDIVLEWNLLNVIKSTADTFSTSAKNLSEIKSWILLKNIAHSLEDTVYELSSSLSLIATLVELGYLKVADDLLIHLEREFSETISCVSEKDVELEVLKLKLLLTKSNLYLLNGRFDEGLQILKDFLGNPKLEKNFKSIKILHVEALMLESKYISVPVSAFNEAENINFLKEHSAIALVMESNCLAKNILKRLADMENVLAHNDWMSFKAILHKSILKGTVQLSELYFNVGEPRHARCFLIEALKLAESHILTFWTSKILLLLGYIDLLCDSPNDCLVKLNALKYVMNTSDKENASLQLSKIYDSSNSSISEESTEEYAISSPSQTPFARSVKQDFLITDVTSSPISNNKKEAFEFEFQLKPAKHCELSIFLVDLEINALGCMHLLATNKEPMAERQLKKLLSSCESLKHSSSIHRLLCSSLEIKSKNCCRAPLASEINMEISTLLKLSDLHFSQKDFKNADSYHDKAIENLGKSSSYYKFLYPHLYAVLKYHKIVRALKMFLNIEPQASLEFSLCPSYKYCSSLSPRTNPADTQPMLCTPTKVKHPNILISPCPDSMLGCKAPVKKEIVPFYIKYDMEAADNLNYSSNDEDDVFTPIKSAPRRNLRSAKDLGKQAPKKSSKSSYTVFKSKNCRELEVKSASDVWKLTDLASPKDAKSELLPLSLQTKRKTRSTRSAKMKTPSKLSLKTQTKAASKSTCEFYVDPVENVESNNWGPRISIEETRSTAKDIGSPKVERFLNFEDVLKLDDVTCRSPGISVLTDLCNDINNMDLNSDKNDKENHPSLPEEIIEKYSTELENLRFLIQHICPYPLYVNVCKLLGILLLAKANYSKDESTLLKSEYLLSETFASTLRHVYLNRLLYNKKAVMSSFQSLCPQSLEPQFSMGSHLGYLISTIPKDYTVIHISALSDKDQNIIKKFSTPKLLISRYQSNSKPLTMCIDSSSNQRFNSFVYSELDTIIAENTVTMKNDVDDSKKWWKTRSALDSRLQALVKKIEEIWLGCWKGLLLSNPVNKQRKLRVAKVADALMKLAKPSNEALLKLFLDSIPFLKQEQISAGVCQLWNCSPKEDLYTQLSKIIRESTLNLPETERHSIILILDKNLQPFPWESLPILEGIPVSRMPSLSLMSSMLDMPDTKSVLKTGCNSDKTFFILNPDNNLENCQKFFQPKFEKYPNWTGVSGRTPSSDECVSALQDHDLFIYCGHGSGKQYLRKTSAPKLKCRATSILMGCSSGRLQPLGKNLEACGLPLGYLMQGCPCIVGNLWNVTDKDIDRFADKFFGKFIPNYQETNTGSLTNIAKAVSKGRKACKMLYLTGAAPVVYGFPVTAKVLS